MAEVWSGDPVPEEWEPDLSSIYYTKGSKYTPEDKIAVAATFATTGNLMKAAELHHVPYDTAKRWKQKAAWWPEILKEIRKQKQEELDGVLTNVIHSAVEALVDRIANGDEVLDHRTGELKLRKLSADSLARVAGILFDKRALIRGDPTTRSEKVTTEATLKIIMDRMEEVAKKMKMPNRRDTDIEGELVSDGIG